VADTIAALSRLAGLLEPGALTASEPGGLAVEERRSVVQLQLIARSGQTAPLAASIATLLGRSAALAPLEGDGTEELFISATGPLEYWALAEGPRTADAVERVKAVSSGCASLFDHSHGRFVVRLSGTKAQTLLAKGTALDLRQPPFPARGAAHTAIAHMPALVIRREPAVYDISGAGSYAGSFVAWLKEAACGLL
jgi:heterotetrameric sarcosine oxidase gamma subunit